MAENTPTACLRWENEGLAGKLVVENNNMTNLLPHASNSRNAVLLLTNNRPTPGLLYEVLVSNNILTDPSPEAPFTSSYGVFLGMGTGVANTDGELSYYATGNTIKTNNNKLRLIQSLGVAKLFVEGNTFLSVSGNAD